MTVALVLAGYAALLATGGAWALRRASWVDRAPRLGIGAWQSLTASVLLAVLFAGLALTVPTVRVSGSLADVLAACVMALRAQYATPAGAAASAAGVMLVVAVAVRLSCCVAAELIRAARWRRQHRETLTLVGRRDARLDAVVVDHATPAAYSLPGWRHRVVLTTATVDNLDADQLAAVLAHERAHLNGRHHLVVAAAAAVARAFPRVPAFARARDEVARLVELAADDAATRTVDRFTVAEALLRLGGPAAPAANTASGSAATLAAAASGATARVRRLIGTHGTLGRATTTFGLTLIALALTAPLALAAGPAAATTNTRCCPGDGAGSSVSMLWAGATGSGTDPCAPHMSASCRASTCAEPR